MAYNFASFKSKTKDIEEWLKRELSTLRTGRATPLILDTVQVEAYGSFMPINQLAGITTEDARTLRITPWDVSQSKDIEKAIITSNLGLSVSVDEKGLRIAFPELTSERRLQLIKAAKGKLEEARISLRGEREKVINDIQRLEKEGEMSEDERFRLKNDLQKIIDEVNLGLEALVVKKETEVSS